MLLDEQSFMVAKGHICTTSIKPWLLNNYGTLSHSLDESIEKFMNYNPNFFGGHKALV